MPLAPGARTAEEEKMLPPDAYHEFPKEEYEGRHARVREEMRRRGMEALLVTSEPNYRYLSGHYTQFWINPTRQRSMVLPLQGEPFVVVGSIEVGRVKWQTWITDIRHTSGPPRDFGFADQTTDLIAEGLRERGLGNARIGTELGMQMRMGFSISDYEGLKRKLQPATLVDASDLLWDVRKIKSPLELVYMRRACDILSAAYADLVKDVVEGMTESELYRRMIIHLMEHGAERPTYIPVNFHEGNRVPPHDHPYSCDVSESRLKRGHIIDLDAGCTFRGYWSDWNRTFAFGTPPERAKKAYRLMQDTMEAALSAAKPGASVAEVARAGIAFLKRAGFSEQWLGRAGHGTGLAMPEPPSILDTETTLLVPGMVICIEPNYVVDGYGPIVAEEQIVVTERGYELLSRRASRNLPVL
jgi:Xaa-Pro dipeptidase